MYILISLSPLHISRILRYYEVIFCYTEFKITRFTLKFVSIDLVEIKYINDSHDKKELNLSIFQHEMTMIGFNFSIGIVLKTAI